MKIAILTANLGDFDTPIDPIEQEKPEGVTDIVFHRYTDQNFPPITGLTPRLQYRIPKLFGYEMFPGYDIYLWLDGAMSLPRADSVRWFVEQLGDSDIAFFNHPWRHTVKEEVDHIEEYLQKGNDYIVSRYKNGLHKEMYQKTIETDFYEDNFLYASTVFIYRDTIYTQEALKKWWFYQSRFYTCDQVNLPLALYESEVDHKPLEGNLFKHQYVSLVSKHK